MYTLLVAFIEPYTFLLFSLLVALLWAWWGAPERRGRLTIALALLAILSLLSMPATGYLGLGSLEWSYPPVEMAPSSTDTIVVLAGDSSVERRKTARLRLGGETIARCLEAKELYKRAGRCSIIVSGGEVDPQRPNLTLANGMRDFLLDLGIPDEDLRLEGHSRTTFENAANTSQLLLEHPTDRVFLVTTAFHMRRASLCFRRQGVKTIPAPCNHQTLGFELSVDTFIPSANGILGVHRAMHEWLGLLWYYLRGRI
jgi:uncharacterized SAM-binding protein YcdF (DUF218 family)